MKKISIYIPLLALAACAAEEATELESPVDYDSPKIVVCGGSTAPGVTRADGDFPEPYNIGTCKADKIKILTFNGVTSENGNLLLKNVRHIETHDTDLFYNLNYRDKWTTHNISLALEGARDNCFAFPSIAYNSEEENDFILPSVTENTLYGDLKLSIPMTTSNTVPINIPELYFGRLKPDGYKLKSSHEAEDITFKTNYGTSYTETPLLEGKLYRIVSQLNINLSEVSDNIDKIEMYLSNLPTEIGLYAKHRTELDVSGNKPDRGYYYPIVEATGDDQHSMKESYVCCVTNKDFSDGTAKLSTFILPSDKGREVTIKAYFKTPIDETGNKTIARTLRAAQNYSLDEETSRVYFSNTELPVYNATTNEFMSYPNVRVNVSGKLSDIFSEESGSNVEIEICPNYDGEHKITI